jgi:Protein of unknown function (DUF2917)
VNFASITLAYVMGQNLHTHAQYPPWLPAIKGVFNPHQEFLMRAFSDDFLQQYSHGILACTATIAPSRATAASTVFQPLARSGAYALQPGTALRLKPAQAAVLRVATGRIWATLGNPAIDHVLCAGDRLDVAAGDLLGIESWPEREAGGAAGGERVTADAGTGYFDWTVAQ